MHVYSSVYSSSFFPIPVAEFQFVSDIYFAFENDSFAEVCVQVLSGELDQPKTLSLTASATDALGTARGE